MLFYVIGLFFLITDLTTMSLAHTYITHLTLWFYVVNLALNHLSIYRIGYSWFLLALLAYLQWGMPFLELCYFIPVTALGIFLRPKMHYSWHLPLILCLVTLAIQTVPLEVLILRYPLKDFTIRKIFISMLSIIVIIFLTYRRGNSGNRL